MDVNSPSSRGSQLYSRLEAVVQDTRKRFVDGYVEQPCNLADMSLPESDVETSKVNERLAINGLPSAGSDSNWSQEPLIRIPIPSTRAWPGTEGTGMTSSTYAISTVVRPPVLPTRWAIKAPI